MRSPPIHPSTQTNQPTNAIKELRWSLPLAATLVLTLTSCSNLPTPRLLNADNESIDEATIEVGESAIIYARSSAGSNFPVAYAWTVDDRDVLEIVEITELGGTAESAEVIGMQPGTATLRFGSQDTSDSVAFTVVTANDTPETEPDPEPEPEPIPSLTLEAASSWWNTTPEADLSSFSTLRIQATFVLSDTSPTYQFTGSGGDADPADELQLGSSPSSTTLTATFTEFPEGAFGPGDTLTWDITVDLSTWPEGDTVLTFRPDSALDGTLLPTVAQLSSSDLVVTR